MRSAHLGLSVILAMGVSGSPWASGSAAAQQFGGAQVPRDQVRPATGTASIRGRITDAVTGAPIRRVAVQIRGTVVPDGRSVFTDADGRYLVADLPAGPLNLSVSKSGFVSLSYGQTRPAEPSRQLQLTAGQSLTDVNFALQRAGV